MADAQTKKKKKPAPPPASPKDTQRAFTGRSSGANVRALIIPIRKDDTTPRGAGPSKEAPEDPLEGLAEQGQIIEPPFDLLTLSMLQEHNSELGQCIAAMETNIDGFGHRLVCRVKKDDPEIPKKLKDKVEAERIRMTNFFAYAAGDDSFTAFRRKLRVDLEDNGNAYIEILRDTKKKVAGFNHLPSYQMRLSRQDADAILVKTKILQLKEGNEVVVGTLPVWKRFRKYAQARWIARRSFRVTGTADLRWFKEFGDPRVYDNTTGVMITDEKGKVLKGKKQIPEENRANELIHLRLYSPRTPYGLPRYIGNLLSIFGDRAAEEINYTTFRNNNIPSMFLLVSNGQMTQASIDRIKDFTDSQIGSSDNWSTFILLEAEPPESDGEDQGQVKLDVKPLTGEQHQDALFQKYSANNQDKVRRSFRLPPIFVGRADEYTRATAEASRRLADEQVFAPERDEFDHLINRRIFPEMGVVHHRYKSNSPNTTDNTELVKILAGAEKTGGMTPRIARMMLEDILGVELPEFPEDFDADVPFSLAMAEAVKNKADPTEPGQQVTALKVLETIEKLTSADLSIFEEGITDEQLADRVIKVQERLEKRWRQEALED